MSFFSGTKSCLQNQKIIWNTKEGQYSRQLKNVLNDYQFVLQIGIWEWQQKGNSFEVVDIKDKSIKCHNVGSIEQKRNKLKEIIVFHIKNPQITNISAVIDIMITWSEFPKLGQSLIKKRKD